MKTRTTLRAWAIVVLGHLTVLACAAAEPAKCFEDEGHAKHDAGQWKEAYALLAPCEQMDGVKGITLYRLADHVGYGGLGEFPSERKRSFKQTGLYFRSALAGFKAEIWRVAEIMDDKHELFGSKDALRISECLKMTIDLEKSKRSHAAFECIKGKRVKGMSGEQDREQQLISQVIWAGSVEIGTV